MPYKDVDISLVAADASLVLRGRGAWRKASICPFCGSKTGLSLNVEKNVFTCHACTEKGGALHLYARLKGISKGAAYKELFGNDHGQVIKKKQKKENIGCDITDINQRDKAYRCLLSKLVLSKRHLESLKERGLTALDIKAKGYKSMPKSKADAMKIAEAIASAGINLEGVPGFFKEGSKWTFSIFKGFLIPVRDMDDRIQMFQIRLDKGKMRYIAFSSSGKNKGASTKSFLHLSMDGGRSTSNALYLTEGALKADVISALGGADCFGILGVNSQADLSAGLRWFKNNGGRKIYLAFDADMMENFHVIKAMISAIDKIKAEGLEFRILTWGNEYRKNKGNKGFDDLLSFARKNGKSLKRSPLRISRKINLADPSSWN